MSRLETGVVRCDGDWPGIFIRGDEAFGKCADLAFIAAVLAGEISHERGKDNALLAIKRLQKLLKSCKVPVDGNVQEISMRKEGE